MPSDINLKVRDSQSPHSPDPMMSIQLHLSIFKELGVVLGEGNIIHPPKLWSLSVQAQEFPQPPKYFSSIISFYMSDIHHLEVSGLELSSHSIVLSIPRKFKLEPRTRTSRRTSAKNHGLDTGRSYYPQPHLLIPGW